MKTLPNNNYLICKLQTNTTQILHRIRLKPCPTKDRLPDIQVQFKEFQPDDEVEILHDDLYALAWQSGFEHFVTPPELNSSDESAIFPTDKEDNPEYVAQDANSDILSEDQPDEQEIQSEPTQTQNLVPPGKENITFVATPLQIGKEIMLITILWSST